MHGFHLSEVLRKSIGFSKRIGHVFPTEGTNKVKKDYSIELVNVNTKWCVCGRFLINQVKKAQFATSAIGLQWR